MGEPERRGDERSEAPRSGGSPTGEREVVPGPPDPEVPARHVRRRFTTAYKLEVLRKADACARPGEIGALLPPRRALLVASGDLAPAARARLDAEEAWPEADVRGSARDEVGAGGRPPSKRPPGGLSAACSGRRRSSPSQKKVAELLGIPLKPLPSDEDD